MIIDHLKYACSAKTLEGFRVLMHLACLREKECVAHEVLHRIGQRPEIFVTGAYPGDRLPNAHWPSYSGFTIECQTLVRPGPKNWWVQCVAFTESSCARRALTRH